MHTRPFKQLVVGMTMATSMVLLSACSGTDGGNSNESDAVTSAEEIDLGVGESASSEAAPSESDPVTTAELDSAIQSLTVNGNPLTVQTMSSDDLDPDELAQLTEQLNPDALGITPPECADMMTANTSQAAAGTPTDTVTGATSDLGVVITAMADSADQLDLSDRSECSTIQMNGMTVQEVDATTDADTTFAYTTTMDVPGSDPIIGNSVMVTYRDALITITGSGAPGSTSPSMAELEPTVNNLVAALG